MDARVRTRRATVVQGDCVAEMRAMAARGIVVHAVVTDPPYHLQATQKRFANSPRSEATEGKAAGPYKRTGTGFMGTNWDGGAVAFDPETWRAALDLLPPGGHLVAFSGSRTYHRMACAIEDAGFEIRDQVGWLYGTGFPKSHDVSKGIDRAAGVDPDLPGPVTEEAAEWRGWGTALKPAWEPIVLARKPLVGTVAGNVLEHGTGALNVDACRVPTSDNLGGGAYAKEVTEREQLWGGDAGNSWRRGGAGEYQQPTGRWPANVVHDGGDEVEGAFSEFGESKGGSFPARRGKGGVSTSGHGGQEDLVARRLEGGSASRFFYCAKASKAERAGSKHPTVKPVALMRWLIRMVTPPGGTVLDPFAGTGTTGEAALLEGFRCMLVEREEEYVGDLRRRLQRVATGGG